jgi:acid phosphatase family membrane protein YuiD
MNGFFAALFANEWLWAAGTAWTLAQVIKLPLEYLLHHEWNWHLLISAGGMPSSHSALVTAVTTAIGLTQGFDSPLFAVSCVLSLVVIYDATGVRRHAGDQARVINLMIDELLTGHPLAEKELKEVLGHTPREVVAGIALGIIVGIIVVNIM